MGAMGTSDRIFIAYRSTGEDLKTLRHRMRQIVESLEKAGCEVYVNAWEHERFRSSGMTRRQIIDEGFGELDASGTVLVLIDSDDRSEGQIMEVGYAYAKGKRLIVAVKEGVDSSIPAMADVTIRWKDVPDLCAQLARLKP